jgi:hypothetical protein
MSRFFWVASIVLFALAGCGKKSEEGGSGGGGGGAAAPSGGGGGNAAKVEALKAAWEAAPECKALVSCCAAIPGSNYEQTVGPICEQVKTYQDFEQQAENLVDPGWQTTLCKNTFESMHSMANAANPLPEGCAKP